MPGATFMAGLCWRQPGAQDLGARLPDGTTWATANGTVAVTMTGGTPKFVAEVTTLAGTRSEPVWTGCTASGLKKPEPGATTTKSCSQWNSTAGVNDKGGLGDPTKPDSALDSGEDSCPASHRWYCFEISR